MLEEETSKDSLFYAEGLEFSCLRCSACCRHESGYVYLSSEDTTRLEAALGLGRQEFIKTYCRWIPSDNGKRGARKLSLKEAPNLDCILWAGGCSVYEARPLQCQAFPFWPSIMSSAEAWEAAAKDCPGMNQGSFHSGESIEKWLSQRQEEPGIFRAGAVRAKVRRREVVEGGF